MPTSCARYPSTSPRSFRRSTCGRWIPRFIRAIRSLFVGALRNDVVTAAEPEIRQLIRDGLAGLARRNAGVQAAMALEQALDRIATRSLFAVVLGVRGADSELSPLEEAYRRLGPDGYAAQVGLAQRRAFHDIRRTVIRIVDRLRGMPTHALADSVLERLAAACPDSIDETVIGNCIYMIERGRHDLRDLLRWVIKMLSDHPEVVGRLRETGAAGALSRLAEACVQETLRLEQAELIVRRTHAPISLNGFHVPKGSLVCALMRETHRDPAVFPDPDVFRPERFLERKYSSDEYSPFGIDQHQCIGRTLIFRAGTMLVEELTGGYGWSVVGDGPRCFGQYHWQPSHDFAIELRSRHA